MEQIPIKEIDLHSVIPYNVLHPMYGRAEFVFCPVFKRGYLDKLFIYRKQQANPEGFVLDLAKKYPGISEFSIEAHTHRTEPPRIWRNGWCKEHKCVLFEVYVPNNTNRITFSCSFGYYLSISMGE